MQGGGAYIESGGSASFVNCAFYGNEAYEAYGNEAGSARARFLNHLEPSSSAPLELYTTDAYFCMQGGGVRVVGSANFQNCQIFNNKASLRVRSR